MSQRKSINEIDQKLEDYEKTLSSYEIIKLKDEKDVRNRGCEIIDYDVYKSTELTNMFLVFLLVLLLCFLVYYLGYNVGVEHTLASLE